MRLAIFDVDGTVLRGNSWQEYFWWAVRRWPRQAPGLLVTLAGRKLGLVQARALRDAALRPLRGMSREDVGAVGRVIFENVLKGRIRAAARAEIARARAEGFVPVLATGTFHFLAEPIAQELGVEATVCTGLEFAGEECRGCIGGAETRGAAKAAAVAARFSGRMVNWAGSRAYSDELEDAPLWAMVGDAVLVCAAGCRPAEAPERVRVVEWADA